jgi:beta-aspartyl-peptidase (threonine type)
MDGATRDAGAVNGVTATRNPVSLARAVMEHSPHVFLSREGADEFSRQQDLEQAPPAYFHVPERRRQLDEMRSHAADDFFDIDVKYGTVGAVALDVHGHVAAATSTGGLTGKRWGRIGDCPVIGAGTYADDRAGAVSCTGAGEYFLRAAVAHEICAQLRFRRAATGAEPGHDEVQAIADGVLAEVKALGGAGGLILVTPWGDAVTRFTTPGMYRGLASPNGRAVAIYGDEEWRGS